MWFLTRFARGSPREQARHRTVSGDSLLWAVLITGLGKQR